MSKGVRKRGRREGRERVAGVEDRLLYEAAPQAFVTEAAGGAASTGQRRMLDVERSSLYQAVPVALGSRHEVAEYERAVAGEG